MYGWANSGYTTVVMAALLPPFFGLLAAKAGVPADAANAYWAYANALAMVGVACAGPILGVLSDLIGGKKRFLIGCVLLGSVSCVMLAVLGPTDYRSAAGWFVVSSLGFALGNIFYESLLPHVARPEDLDRVSARGYAFSALGGGVLLLLAGFWMIRPRWFGMPDATFALKAGFVSVGIWWTAFTRPLWRHVPEPSPAAAGLPWWPALKLGLRQLARTLRAVGQHRQLALFLIAFWIYNDGISTIIRLATKYGQSVGIGQRDLVLALILTQFIGFPCAIAFGRLAGLIGRKGGILLGIGVYVVISVLGFHLRTPTQFYLLAGLVALVQGGTQALSRSLFASMVPRHQAAEFFGFYSTGSRCAGILGPLVFGLIAQGLGSRWGILSLTAFFIVGGALLCLVHERRP